MKWFYNLKIGTKLTGAFVLLSMITAIVGYEGLTNMSMINSSRLALERWPMSEESSRRDAGGVCAAYTERPDIRRL